MSDDGTPYTDAFSFISPESRNEANTDHDKENTEETSEGAAKDSEQANQTYTLRPRDRKMTPKGLDWQVDKICSDFISFMFQDGGSVPLLLKFLSRIRVIPSTLDEKETFL
jgi:hypothetical protein